MKNNEIKYIDPIISKISKPLIPLIAPALEYDNAYYKQDRAHSWIDKEGKKQFKKVRENYKANMINRRSGSFLTGLIPLLEEYAKRHKIDIEINEDEKIYIKPENKPNLKGVVFREDQLRQIETATLKMRGVLKAPTATGKTYLLAGFLSQYKKKRSIVLCHNVDILAQTGDKLKEFGFDDVQVIHGKSKDKIGNGINLITIQTFSKMDLLKYADYFAILVIDECHHVNSIAKSQYGDVLQKSLAPIKIGLTASLHEDRIKLLAMIGLIGPVIDEVTVQEGIEGDMLVKPFITLYPVKLEMSKVEIKAYKDIYRFCIVENEIRNRTIVKHVIKRAYENKTSLIMVTEIQHGKILMSMFKKFKMESGKFKFVRGASSSETRMELKKALNSKEISVIICTVVWKEGISINSLNSLVNAGGGKSSINTLQVSGRALRKDEGKTEVEIVDFLDPYRILAQHSVARITTYVESGWL